MSKSSHNQESIQPGRPLYRKFFPCHQTPSAGLRRLHSKFIPCHQTSSGDRRHDYRLPHPRHPQPLDVLPHLPVMEHCCCSTPPSYSYRLHTLSGERNRLAQTTPGGIRVWVALLCHEALYLCTCVELFFFSTLQPRTQREFSASTNVRELYIANLDIPSFIPTIQQYFGQFSPTVRFLTLRAPKGSHRQVVFFVGLFQHLEDFVLRCDQSRPWAGDYPKLIPPFVPPLRGWLTVTGCREYGLAKTMVDLFGGVRFRHVVLLHMAGTQLLVYACADALEGLWLDATDICGEGDESSSQRVYRQVLRSRFGSISERVSSGT